MNTNYLKDFVPDKQALALKELGFDELCFGYYLCKNSAFGVRLEITTNWIDLLPYDSSSCKAPTYSQAFRWFREKYGLDSAVLKDRFVIETEEDLPTWYYGFNTYEEAELDCLNKLIEIVKQQL
jgi:hypothetical protein